MPDLNWAQWNLIGLYAFAALVGIATIGKERKPRTAGEAVFGLLVCIVAVFLVWKAGAP